MASFTALVAFSAFGLASVGCGGDVVVDATSSTTTTGTGGTGGASTMNGTSGTGVIGGPGGSPTGSSCTCACITLMSAGGCGDICSTLLNGATTSNFCEGQPPLNQCAACLASNCAGLSTTAGTCAGE